MFLDNAEFFVNEGQWTESTAGEKLTGLSQVMEQPLLIAMEARILGKYGRVLLFYSLPIEDRQ